MAVSLHHYLHIIALDGFTVAKPYICLRTHHNKRLHHNRNVRSNIKHLFSRGLEHHIVQRTHTVHNRPALKFVGLFPVEKSGLAQDELYLTLATAPPLL